MSAETAVEKDHMNCLAMKAGLAWAGATLVGGLMGAPYMAVATSVAGGIGAGAGYAMGCVLRNQVDALQFNGSEYVVPFAGAVGVMGLVTGRLDGITAALAAGSVGANFVGVSVLSPAEAK